jgi:hypothetical protein
MEKLDPIAQQHRFWKAIAEHTPEVMEDLFERRQRHLQLWLDDRSDMTTSRWNREEDVAREWCTQRELPDWCLKLAKEALLKRRHPSNTTRECWDLAAARSPYYFLRPPALEFDFNPWSTDTPYAPISRDEYLNRVEEVATEAAGAHYDKYIASFPWFSANEYQEFRRFDTECRRLCLRLAGYSAEEIAEGEGGDVDVSTVSKGAKKVAKALGIELPDDRGKRGKRKRK